MTNPTEVQRNAQFQQLIGQIEQVNETMVTSSAQLTAIANQILQVRQYLQQVKATAPAPDAPYSPDKLNAPTTPSPGFTND